MYNFFSKNGMKASLTVSVSISLITLIMLLASDSTEIVDVVKYSSAADFGLVGSYILGFGCIISAVVLPLLSMLEEPKKMLVPMAGLGALLLLFIISWMISDSYTAPKLVEVFDVSEGESKVIGGTLIMTYTLVIGVIFLAIYSEITNLFK